MAKSKQFPGDSPEGLPKRLPRKIRRITWGIDAFEDSGETSRPLIATLKCLCGKMPIKVEPVYVLSPGQLGLPVESFQLQLKEYMPAVENAMSRFLEGVDLPGMLEPKIAFQNKPSLVRAVKTLVSHAKLSGADLIAIGTHARSGISRLMLGSFAETLLLQSRIPVLVAGPIAPQSRIDRVLFATDFGKKSAELFLKVLDLSRSLGASLTVFHAIPNPVQPVFQTGVYYLGGGWVPVPEYLSREEDSRKRLVDSWIASAASTGGGSEPAVEVEYVCRTGAHGVAQAILEQAECQNVGLIAMAAESGPLASAIIGSITRQVIRNAPCPVWVMRP